MKLGLGTVQLGLSYGISNKTGKPLYESALRILHSAYNSGINTFDTAAAYGDSEKLIGDFLKQAKPVEHIKIASKSLPLKNLKGSELDRKIHDALSDTLLNLNLTAIDYYLLHSASDLFDNGKEITDVYKRYQQSGIINRFGVSVYSEEDIYECFKYENINIIQIPFNILDNRLIKSGLIDEMNRRGIEIHARSIYLQGLLTMEANDIPEKLSTAKDYIHQIDAIAEGMALTRKQLLFLYVRDTLLISKMFVGCETIEQLNENIQMNSLPNLDSAMLSKLSLQFSNVPIKLLNPSLWG